MTNQDSFLAILREFEKLHNVSLGNIERDLSETSYDSANDYFLYKGSGIRAISMDDVAKGYRDVYGTSLEPDNNHPPKTADAFLITKTDQWFLIEFKNAVLEGKSGGLKSEILSKAYQNWYMILDLLYATRDMQPYDTFHYRNPIEFARDRVQYILVISEEKNPRTANYIAEAKRIKQKHTPGFMWRIKDYLFNDAFVYTETYFEMEFVKKFYASE